jgi:hypothetical protein
MTEQNEDMPMPKMSTGQKLGLGAALVVLPLGSWAVYNKLENTNDPVDKVPGKGISLDQQMRQVDPAMIKYKEVVRFDTGFASPKAIALDSKGNILAAAEGTIRRFSPTGAVLGNMSISGTPYCIAEDSSGVIFVGMKDHVAVYGADGQRVASWPSLGEKSYLTSITINGDDVWVGDAGQRMAIRLDRNGKILGTLGKPDPARGIPGLQMPSPHLDVVVGADGLIWLNNTGMHRLEGYKPDGTLSRFWGVAGTSLESFPGCCNPADFAVLKDGSFITAEKVTPRIKQYTPDGVLDSVVAAPTSFGQNMTGIDVAVDGNGRVIVMERGMREVRIFQRIGSGT